MDITKQIKEELFTLGDLKYKEFHTRLMPGVPHDKIIGIRIPALRALAKKLKGREDIKDFLNSLPHSYYEENNLHAFLIEQIEDFDECILEIEKFLPFIDNWATCDSLRPKCFKKNSEKLLCLIEKWMTSGHAYTVRFAIEMLMIYFLDEKFDKKYADAVADIKSEEYYVNMMAAWYFATALAKQYDVAIKYVENGNLTRFVHNKTIQKAVESYRITKEQKTYLKTLKK